MTNDIRVARVFLALSALLVVLAIACGDSNPTSPGSTPAVSTGSTTSPGTGSSGTGTLKVMLKDSPFTEASAVLVTFNEVTAHMSGGAWTSLSSGLATGALPVTCDLLKLRAGAQLLGIGTVAAGHYTQLRLLIATTPMSVALYQGGTVPPATVPPTACVATADAATMLVPSGADPEEGSEVTVTSGEIKLNREFTVEAGTTMIITLDFDGEKSVHKTGSSKYMMSPVISVVSVVVQP
ncbi:MAG: hypothetical protein H6Q86_285 [candidate division NC10 bacterium]|jgi:hypothetical protein|nr:hypothetical protein [candidate division NC10 bacterium]